MDHMCVQASGTTSVANAMHVMHHHSPGVHVCVHVAIKVICKGDVGDPPPPAGNAGGNAQLPVDNPMPADPPPTPPAPAVPPPGL